MKKVAAALVSDRGEIVEIDGVESSHSAAHLTKSVPENNDMFKNLDLSKIQVPKKIRQKAYRLQRSIRKDLAELNLSS